MLNEKSVTNELKLNIFPLISVSLRNIMQKIPEHKLLDLEEIRLRMMKPFMLVKGNMDYMVTIKGELTNQLTDVYFVTKDDIEKTFQLISKGSVYALEEEIKNGYITIPGGHRVGLAGKAVLHEGQIKTLKHICSLNIRIAREVIGAADNLIDYLTDERKAVYNTLILSPPKAGKTTLLRDLIRQLSNGDAKRNIKGYKIGLVDERSEIACCYEGKPQNNVGIRTDVIDGCPKAVGIVMLLRSMSPDIIATDEVGRHEDVLALQEAINAGVTIIATAHGNNLEEIMRRPIMHELLENRMFKRYVFLGFSSGVGSLEKIFDEDFNLIKHFS